MTTHLHTVTLTRTDTRVHTQLTCTPSRTPARTPHCGCSEDCRVWAVAALHPNHRQGPRAGPGHHRLWCPNQTPSVWLSLPSPPCTGERVGAESGKQAIHKGPAWRREAAGTAQCAGGPRPREAGLQGGVEGERERLREEADRSWTHRRALRSPTCRAAPDEEQVGRAGQGEAPLEMRPLPAHAGASCRWKPSQFLLTTVRKQV